MAFRFLQFEVKDQQSTQRVGTDAMLLGSWARPPENGRILDIGTGCGVLALMMAQRSGADIDAIDIDPSSVEEAQANFLHSPWPLRMRAFFGDAGTLTVSEQEHYSFIITNPPWFSASLKSPSLRRNRARHDDLLPLPRLAEISSRLLAPGGTLALVLPSDEENRCLEIFREQEYAPSRLLTVFPNPGKKSSRILLEFKRAPLAGPERSELTIRGRDGKFTPGYLALTRDFHRFNSTFAETDL
ncbi:MAG TPA: methyltransferase [Bacteroidales bacterium]|nr:methyltransferase [Bacteroidales bacterium]